MKPIVKWVGGKTKLLPELDLRLPDEFGRYYEPFAGGAALFFHLRALDVVRNCVLADANDDLMLMYETVAAQPSAVKRLLLLYKHDHSESQYYGTRELFNRTLNPIQRAAAFIYLNKTCYNGLWRVNGAGEFNVPMGRYKNPAIFDPDELRAASTALAGTQLRRGDFRHTTQDVREGDFVYFDPPYVPVSETASFTNYTPDGFNLQAQRDLAEYARELSVRGVQVMLSNSDTPRVQELYKGFHIERVECGRAINSDASKRGKVGELIIRNYT